MDSKNSRTSSGVPEVSSPKFSSNFLFRLYFLGQALLATISHAAVKLSSMREFVIKPLKQVEENVRNKYDKSKCNRSSMSFVLFS